jgi:cytochrome d ubiquinol oxidase subunit I
MNEMILSRWQFGITTVYHFFFVPLTIGLGFLLAIMETLYLRTGHEKYMRMTKFWGKLFLINFIMGVVTGLVQEFQFGLNWAEYSRYVGDIFGAPLAIETLTAFFLESVFLGIWFFGWDRISPKLHVLSIWLVAIGSIISAAWILIANSFMHEPVGFVERNGRLELADFAAVVFNPHAGLQISHVVFASITTAAFFILGISAYHLLKNSAEPEIWKSSFRIGTVAGFLGVVLTMAVGHPQGQYAIRHQPMKMAAAEALWYSEDPAGLSMFSLISEKERRNIFTIRIPFLLGLLAYNRPYGEVKGMNELQAAYEKQYGPGDYIPPVHVCYWSFRAMVGAGLAMGFLGLLSMFYSFRKYIIYEKWFFTVLIASIALPYIANATGWILTEMGRQPWIVYGLMKTSDAVSKALSPNEAAFSLIVFTVLYAVLIVVDVFLLRKYAVAGPAKA